jgi:hypothetical protein
MNHLPWPGQSAQITVDHHPVKTVVYKEQQAAKQLCERLHRSPFHVLVWTTRSSDGQPVGSNFKYVWLVLLATNSRTSGSTRQAGSQRTDRACGMQKVRQVRQANSHVSDLIASIGIVPALILAQETERARDFVE